MSEPHKPVGAIFDAAIELPPERRAAYLHEACGRDDSLRQRVAALLRAHELAQAFMDHPAVDLRRETVVVKPAEQPGDRIGRYKLLQHIGEGGCGVVYMAEQEEPVRRRVALKVIKLGMDTKQVVARFEAERQALALSLCRKGFQGHLIVVRLPAKVIVASTPLGFPPRRSAGSPRCGAGQTSVGRRSPG